MDGPLLIYDGDCGFCTSSARWVARRWTVPARAVPWQRLGAPGLGPLGLAVEDTRRTAWWVEPGGGRWPGHEAIARALAATGGWPALAGRALLVPPLRWAGAAAYPAVSRFRHRLPGGTPACRT